MVCGLVDIEFCKLVLGLQSQGVDKFLNSNINLATGSLAFNAFSPSPPVAIKTSAGAIGSFSSWDKLELAGVSSVGELVALIEGRYGVTVNTLYDPQVPIDRAPNGVSRLPRMIVFRAERASHRGEHRGCPPQISRRVRTP